MFRFWLFLFLLAGICGFGVTEPSTFSVDLDVSGAKTTTLVFGMDPDAEDNHDETFDIPLSPPSPGGSDIAFLVDGTIVSRLRQDIKKTDDNGRYWRLSITLESDDTLTLSWTDSLPAYLQDKALTLRAADGDLLVDMKTSTSVSITASGLYYLAVANAGNHAPSADDDQATTIGDDEAPEAVSIPVLSNDSDSDGDEVSLVQVQNPSDQGGSVTFSSGSGAVSYTPPPGWYGTDHFTYRITDDYPIPLTAEATVTVEVSSYVRGERSHALLVSPGETMTVTVQITPSGDLYSLELVEFLPEAPEGSSVSYWQYVSGSCTLDSAIVPTQDGAELHIDFGTSVPTDVVTFSYDVTVPEDESRALEFDGELRYRVLPGSTPQVANMSGTTVGVVTPGVPEISIADAEVTEGDSGETILDFTVTLTKVSDTNVTVEYASADGTATVADADYVSTQGTLTFVPPETRKTISVSVLADETVESDESLQIGLSNPVNATLALASATGWIRNDDLLPPTLSISNASLSEGNSGETKMWFTVTASRSSDAEMSVDYQTVDGSAAATGGDYLAASGSLTFTSGQTSRTFSVIVYGDTLYETDEAFTVALSEPVNADISSTQGTGTGTILNDDTAPAISIDSVEGSEGDSGQTDLEFTVSLSSASSLAVTVDYASADGTATVADSDYTAVNGTLTFAAGETAKTVTVKVTGDTAVEDDETFTVVLSSPQNATLGTAAGTGTVRNDDTEQQGGAPDWSPPAGVQYTMTVHAMVRLGDDSFLSASDSLLAAFREDTCLGVTEIYDGDAGWQFQLAIGNNNFMETGLTLKVYDASADAIYDLNETVDFVLDTTLGTLASPVEYTTDSGGQPLPAISITGSSIPEGDSGQTDLEFTVSLSSASSLTVTVDYASADGTATVADSDYTAVNGTLTFAAGETAKTIVILVNGDTQIEADETVHIDLSSAVNAEIETARASGTIQDDDQVLPSLSIADSACREGFRFESVLVFEVTLSSPSLENVSVAYATVDGTARVDDADYRAAAGRIVFEPGETSRSIYVVVNPDDLTEESEQMTVVLSDAVNGTIAESEGTGTIEDFEQDASLPACEQDASGWKPKTGVQYSMTLHARVQYPDGSVLSAAGSKLAALKDGEILGVTEIYDSGAGWQFQLAIGSNSAVDSGLSLMVYDASLDIALNISETVDFLVDDTVGSLLNPETFTVDATPVVSVADVTVLEGSPTRTSIQFVITLSWASDSSVTVSFSSADGTASGAAGDYTPFSGTVTFAPGETEKTITLTVNDDDETEGDEDFFIVLLEADGGILADPVARATVTDDESSSLPTVAISGGSADEGGAVTFTVTLSEASVAVVSVDYATEDGSASSAGGDYLAASGEIEFAAGETEKTITVVVYSDTEAESSETFTVTLSNPVNAVLGDVFTATGTIREVAVPAISIGDASGYEGSTLEFRVTLSSSFPSTVSVNYTTLDGSATSAGGDYEAGSGTLTFSPGETEKTIAVTTYTDSSSEGTETFSVTLSGPVNATLSDSTGVGTLTDLTLPKISMEDSSAYEGYEGTSTYSIVVRIDRRATTAVTVDYQTYDDTATLADSDYVASSGTLVFTTDNEEAELSIPIQINGDLKIEENETIRVVLSNATNAVILDGEAIFTIRNDDQTPPTIAVHDAQTLEGATLQFTVELSHSTSVPVVLTYTVTDGSATASEGDYEVPSGTLTIPRNTTKGTISITTHSDVIDESDETVFLTITSASYGTLSDSEAVGTIQDVVPPDIGIGNAEYAEGAAGQTLFEFLVVLSNASLSEVTVDYETFDGTATVADGDYEAGSGTVTFSSGETVYSIFVPVNGDTVSEADETFGVRLSNASGGTIVTAEATAVILDDEARWYPSFDLGVEGILNVTIRSEDGTPAVESQVADLDEDGFSVFGPEDYRSGTGTGRSGLLPGVYYASVAVWDQEFQEFRTTGSIVPIPEVTYSVAEAPDEAAMSSAQLGESNRNWVLSFAGVTQAQGMVIQVRDETSGTITQEIVREFLPEEGSDIFPTGPTDSELAQVHLSTGAFQWRLRFFTPLDSPDTTTGAENWSEWMDIVTLTADTIDSPRKPTIPSEADRWYYPESGAVFSADAETGKATVDFEWNPVLNADCYYIHVSTAEGKAAVNCRLVSLPQLHDAVLSPGSYYWALRPANSELGADGIADSWMSPFPSFTVLPSEDYSTTIPGQVTVTGLVREVDGYLCLSLVWTGRVASHVRILVLNPGFMIEAAEDRDSSSCTFTTDRFDAYLDAGDTTFVKVQGISDSGETGPWSSFVLITIPAVP